MSLFNLWPSSAITAEWTVESGTLAEWLAKRTEDPTAPALTPLIKSASKTAQEKFAFAGASSINFATEKVVGVTLHVYIKNSVASSAPVQVALMWGADLTIHQEEPTVTSAAKWITLTLSKGEAEEAGKTQAALEELHARFVKTATSTVTLYDAYVVVTTEPTGKKTVEEAMSARTGAVAGASAVKVATGATAARTGALASSSATRVVQGSAPAVTGARASTSSVKVATGSTTVVTGARASTASRLVATGSMRALTGALVTITVSGRKIVEGSMSAVAGAIVTAPAVKVATGSLGARTGAVVSIAAKRAVQGAVTATTGARLAAPGRKVAVGQTQAVTGARLSTITSATFVGAMRTVTGARLILESVVPPPPPLHAGEPLTGQSRAAQAGGRVGTATGVDRAAMIGSDLGPRTGEAR